MSAVLSFKERLLAILVPTPAQSLWAIIVSLLILTITHSRAVLERLGVNSGVLHSLSDQFHAQFDGVLRSEIVSQLAVITFWAVVGLMAYLLCWGAYNILVEARNEVTLNTVYTNRGNWRSPYHTLGLKAASAIGFGIMLVSIRFGIEWWTLLVGGFVWNVTLTNGLLAAAAVVGAAVQLYLVLAFAQLTFTPWYRPGAFTDN